RSRERIRLRGRWRKRQRRGQRQSRDRRPGRDAPCREYEIRKRHVRHGPISLGQMLPRRGFPVAVASICYCSFTERPNLRLAPACGLPRSPRTPDGRREPGQKTGPRTLTDCVNTASPARNERRRGRSVDLKKGRRGFNTCLSWVACQDAPVAALKTPATPSWVSL